MRRFVRFCADWTAFYLASWCAYTLTSSFIWSFAAGIAAAAYGMFCFCDGAKTGESV